MRMKSTGYAALLMICAGVANAAPPPPPMPVYDPQPGPYIVRVAATETERREIAAHALEAWSGPKLQAFQICFVSERSSVNWTVALQTMDAVAGDLLAAGARAVVIPPGRLCERADARRVTGDDHVEIFGVLTAP